MKHPPERIGEAKVVRWSVIDGRHRATGACRQIGSADRHGPVARVAVGRLEDGGGYFLFGCDAEWNVLNDTWHATLADALDQAEFEYEGVSHTWSVE